MPYSNKLIKLTDWYRQLVAESLGKNKKGTTLVRALGATDQHSILQLFMDGPDDKFIQFIKINNFSNTLKIPHPEYQDLTFNKLINIELKATSKALSQTKIPNLTLEIDKIDEETMGELIMLFETSVAFLGEFHNINAYNQPGVELTKNITQELL